MTRVQKVPSHSKKQYFIIGDVHGCFDELMLMLTKVNWHPDANFELLFAGDLINKGPKSYEVLKWVRNHKIRSVIGNHELKFLKCHDKNDELSPSLRELKDQMGSDLREWLHWLEALPKYIETESFLLVHGGLQPDRSAEETDRETLANMRYWDEQEQKMTKDIQMIPWYQLYRGEKPVIYGHWAKQGLTEKKNSIGLDSGCVYGKKLTGIFMPAREIVQVRALGAYQEISKVSSN